MTDFLLKLCVSDDAVLAVKNPFQVRVRNYGEEVPADAPRHAVASIAVGAEGESAATITVPAEDETDSEGTGNDPEFLFIDVAKNRMFKSYHSDAEMAYNGYISELNKCKEVKTTEADVARSNLEGDMISVMKCCMVAHAESLKTHSMCPKSAGEIEFMFKNNRNVYLELVGVYFTTGLSLEISVNNPENIYAICVEKHLTEIMDVVCQRKRFSDRDSRIYALASDCFGEF